VKRDLETEKSWGKQKNLIEKESTKCSRHSFSKNIPMRREKLHVEKKKKKINQQHNEGKKKRKRDA